MADVESLTYAFVGAHPADAAREIEALAAADRLALIAHLPVRLAAPALTHMLPPIAAQTLAALEPAQSQALLSAMNTHSAVAILRHIQEPARTQLIDALATVRALAARLLLGYPEDTVGAWADPDVAVFAPDVRAADALDRVRQSGVANAECIYVLDAAQRLTGLSDLTALLRAAPDARLASLAHAPKHTLAGVTPLAAARGHPVWKESSAVPVVERSGRPIGVLRRTTLERAIEMHGRRTPRETAGEASAAGALAGAYWGILAALIETAVKLLPPLDKARGDAR